MALCWPEESGPEWKCGETETVSGTWGKAIIIHTIEKFAVHPGFDEVLVLSPRAWVTYTQDIVRKFIPPVRKVTVLQGGDTRNETIMNAIRYIEEQGDLDEETVIVTHDSVRPFVTHRFWRRIFAMPGNMEPVIR